MPINWKKTINNFKGRRCTGGIDLSSVNDLTCWVMMFPDDKDPEQVDILMRCWCPESRLYDDRNKYKDVYQAWEKEGYLEATEGNAVDYEYVRARIVSDAAIVQVTAVGIDRYFQGYEFSTKLNEELGGHEKAPKIFLVGMGYGSMAGLTQEFERRLLKGKLNHGGNPVLRFMADNVSTSTDPAGNKKPNKATSQSKIDGIIGILLALDQQMKAPPVLEVRMPELV